MFERTVRVCAVSLGVVAVVWTAIVLVWGKPSPINVFVPGDRHGIFYLERYLDDEVTTCAVLYDGSRLLGNGAQWCSEEALPVNEINEIRGLNTDLGIFPSYVVGTVRFARFHIRERGYSPAGSAWSWRPSFDNRRATTICVRDKECWDVTVRNTNVLAFFRRLDRQCPAAPLTHWWDGLGDCKVGDDASGASLMEPTADGGRWYEPKG